MEDHLSFAITMNLTRIQDFIRFYRYYLLTGLAGGFHRTQLETVSDVVLVDVSDISGCLHADLLGGYNPHIVEPFIRIKAAPGRLFPQF